MKTRLGPPARRKVRPLMQYRAGYGAGADRGESYVVRAPAFRRSRRRGPKAAHPVHEWEPLLWEEALH